MAVQLAPCGVLLPGPVQYCSQHSCIIAVELLLQPFSQRPSSASVLRARQDDDDDDDDDDEMIYIYIYILTINSKNIKEN